MRRWIIVAGAVLAGCNVLPIDIEQGRGALLENPVSSKCVSVSLEEGRIVVPLSAMPFGGTFEMEGTGLTYHSIGAMCAGMPEHSRPQPATTKETQR